MKVSITTPTTHTLSLSFYPTALDYIFTISILIPGLYIAFYLADTTLWSISTLFVFSFLSISQVMPTSTVILNKQKDTVEFKRWNAVRWVVDYFGSFFDSSSGHKRLSPREAKGTTFTMVFPMSQMMGLKIEQAELSEERIKKPAYRLLIGFRSDAKDEEREGEEGEDGMEGSGNAVYFGVPVAESFLFGEKFKKLLEERGKVVAEWSGVEWLGIGEIRKMKVDEEGKEVQEGVTENGESKKEQ